jgi:hypothetical protein
MTTTRCVECNEPTERETVYCDNCRPNRSQYVYRARQRASMQQQRERIAEMNREHDWQNRHRLVADHLEMVEP